jgi:dihydropteroate synthase
MQTAVQAGAGLINDVYALRQPGALDMAAQLQVPVCLMHMQGEPRTMQHQPRYDNVQAEVRQFLEDRARVCEEAGIARQGILIDPGFGFGKTLEHNLALFRGLDTLCRGRYPVLVGVSRKSMLGQITGREVGDRLAASLAAAVLACRAGASVLRVHDVAPTVDALKVCRELGV